MNIVRENREDLTSLLKVTISEVDYNEAVEKALREYKRKANVPGFRPGMVPMGVVSKMYKKGAVAEEAYRAASKACFEYIESEGITFIGDVIPSSEQVALDFDNNTEHEFIFEFAASPEVKIKFSNKDIVTKNIIEINEEMATSYRDNYLRKFGKLVDVPAVELDEALTVTLDNTEINVTDAYVGLISMSEEDRKPFIGKKIGDEMEVNVNELYKTTEQRASILQVKAEELEGINPNFKLTITNIRKFANPELNEEFFKMAFPEGNITDENGLEEYIKGQIGTELGRETEQLFSIDVKKLIIEKAALVMPEAFLKKWLFTINEGKFTMEEIEKDFTPFLNMMRWNLIQKHYVKEMNIEVTKDDVLEEAKALTLMQFAQYGMASLEDAMLTQYAEQVLSNKEEANKIYEKLYERKVIDAVIPMLKTEEKTVSVEDFGKIVDELNKQ